MKLPIFVWTWVSVLPPNWLLNNLVSYYEFEENVLDSHWSNNWVDSWTSDTAWKIWRARSFDWANDKVSLLSPADLDNIFAWWWSFVTWFNVDSLWGANSWRLLDKWPWLTLAFMSWTNKVYFGRNFSSAVWQWYANFALSFTDTWYHLIIVYNEDSTANNPTIYINWISRSIVETNTPSGTATSDASWNMNIWNRDDQARAFDWKIDETWFYTSRMLSSDDALALYNSGDWKPFSEFTT